MSSNVELVITPRENDIGDNFKVRRALPFMKKRMVGPFIFFDHMGPLDLKPGHEMTVHAHPHIGLSTLTYLFSGEILHRDSLQNELSIRPHEVNWMTAGRGIAHSERAFGGEKGALLEGIQVWIALPKGQEEIEPSFIHVDAKEIPVITQGNSQYRLVAGKAFGKESPVPVHSPLFYLSSAIAAQEIFSMKLQPTHEGAVYVAKGELKVEGETYPEGSLIVFKQGSSVDFESLSPSTVVIIGGEVFPEKRFIFWNFVSSSEERLEEAKLSWKKAEFGQVLNESVYLPLPEDKGVPLTPVKYP